MRQSELELPVISIMFMYTYLKVKTVVKLPTKSFTTKVEFSRLNLISDMILINHTYVAENANITNEYECVTRAY